MSPINYLGLNLSLCNKKKNDFYSRKKLVPINKKVDRRERTREVRRVSRNDDILCYNIFYTEESI